MGACDFALRNQASRPSSQRKEDHLPQGNLRAKKIVGGLFSLLLGRLEGTIEKLIGHKKMYILVKI